MKRILLLSTLLCLTVFNHAFAQQRVKVNRWVSPVFKDFISIPENKSTDAQLISFGYKDKIFQYEAFLTRPVGNNIAVVNRWSHPNCGDFIIIAEHEISDQQMTSFGYVNKQFLFYAYQTRPATQGYAAVSRWINVLPVGNPCRDFSLSVADYELTDNQLISWGYTDKKVQFYVPVPIPQVTSRITAFQNEAHLSVEISNAVANRPITIRVSNLPNITERTQTISANAEGKASCTFAYRSLADYCALTLEQKRTIGKIDVAAYDNLITREFPIYQFYATPVGGCR